MVLLSALAFFVLAAAGSGYAAVRALGLWRQARRTVRALGGELARFEARAARTERLLAEAERAGGDLEAALARLRASLQRLRVLAAALEGARRRIRWLAVLLPR